MVKPIARALRWREMLENGTHATIAEIGAAEKINESYVGRVLRLTLLAPDIVEAILNGRQPTELKLEDLLKRFPVGWREQRAEMLDPN
jgi:ParB-like chromosome segregation protein Spo0J